MRPTEFITALRKGPVGAAYFLRGPDRFLQEECRKAVVNSIPPDSRQWCLTELEFAAGQLPACARRRRADAHVGRPQFPAHFRPGGFQVKRATRMWKRCARTWSVPRPFSTVVFLATEPDRRRRFVTLLEKKAQLVELRSPDRREAADWVEHFLQHAGVEIAGASRKRSPGNLKSVRIRAPRPGPPPSTCSGCAPNWKNC